MVAVIIACTILSGKALLPFVQLAQLLSRLNQIISGYKSLDSLMKQPVEHSRDEDFMPRERYDGRITSKTFVIVILIRTLTQLKTSHLKLTLVSVLL